MRQADKQQGMALLVVLLVIFVGMVLLTGVFQHSLLLQRAIHRDRQQEQNRWLLLSAESLVTHKIRRELDRNHSQLPLSSPLLKGGTQVLMGKPVYYQVKDMTGCFNLNWLLIEPAAKAKPNQTLKLNTTKTVAVQWLDALLHGNHFSPLPPLSEIKASLNHAQFSHIEQLQLLPDMTPEKYRYLARFSCVLPLFSLRESDQSYKLNLNALQQYNLPLFSNVLKVSLKDKKLQELMQRIPVSGWHSLNDMPTDLKNRIQNTRYINFGSHHYQILIKLPDEKRNNTLFSQVHFYSRQAFAYQRTYRQ